MKKKTKVKPPDLFEGSGQVDQAANKHLEAAEALRLQCREVSYSVGNLPSARMLSRSSRQTAADALGCDPSRMSASKRLFGGRGSKAHPLVLAVREARAAIDSWRDSRTLVKSAAPTTDTSGDAVVASGVRLILLTDIDEFDHGFRVRAGVLRAAAEKLYAHMDTPYVCSDKTYPSVLDHEREALGPEFDRRDYPLDIRTCIKVSMPVYRDYRVAIGLPKTVEDRMEAMLRQELSETLESATAALFGGLTDTFETFARQLGIVRVYPDKDGPFGKYHGAELVLEKSGGQYTFRRDEPDPENPTSKRKVSETVVLTPEQWETFKAVKTDEKNRITTGTIETMLQQLETFARFRDTLGPYGAKADNALGKVREALTKAGRGADEMAKEARNSVSFRKSVTESLQTAIETLKDTAVEATVVRRRINVSLLEKG